MKSKYKKVIIVGAPRSGTNMLRDVLSSLDGIDTWPCDEINYLWRHDNKNFPSDELSSSNATKKVKVKIEQEFDKLAKKTQAEVVLEKTCANSLRLDFVQTLIPDAKYIFIYRDGIDCLSSAKKRWTADLDLPYLVKKAKYVPLIDLPYYATRYLFNRIVKLFSKQKKLAYWGPQLEVGIVNSSDSLVEICAKQWQRCVEKSLDFFETRTKSDYYSVSYEDFVVNPKERLYEMLDFIEKSVDDEIICKAVENVSSRSVGLGYQELTKEDLCKAEAIINKTKTRLGYSK